MHQTKKGNQWYFGMKAHLGVDSRTKLIHAAVATPANAVRSLGAELGPLKSLGEVLFILDFSVLEFRSASWLFPVFRVPCPKLAQTGDGREA
jgi:hypothetical protein